MKAKRTKDCKGFTLAELLIVVAIIAVLVAVAIPVFNGQLLKAKAAVDLSNMRAAKALAVAAYLDGDYYTREVGAINSDSRLTDVNTANNRQWNFYWVDVPKNKAYTDVPANRNSILAIEPYGQMPTVRVKSTGEYLEAHKDRIIAVAIGSVDGTVLVGWATSNGFKHNTDINSTYIYWNVDWFDPSDLVRA